MKESIVLSQSLSLVISLSLSLSPYVEPPSEGGGAILGTTPHPAMLIINLAITLFTIMLSSTRTLILSILSLILTLTLKPTTAGSILQTFTTGNRDSEAFSALESESYSKCSVRLNYRSYHDTLDDSEEDNSEHTPTPEPT